MDLKKKIVIQIPLQEIWNEKGIISRVKIKYLTNEEVKGLLKKSKVQFVVAKINSPLDWILVEDCFDFFKSNLNNKIADKDENYLDTFPEQNCFYASKWKSESLIPIVLLEMYH